MVTIGQILETFDYFLFENLVAQFVTYNYHHQISFRYVDIRQAGINLVYTSTFSLPNPQYWIMNI